MVSWNGVEENFEMMANVGFLPDCKGWCGDVRQSDCTMLICTVFSISM